MSEERYTLRVLHAAPYLLEALEFLLENIDHPPEKNCSCHINPPCGDCVNHSALRNAIEDSKKAIKMAKGAT